MTVKLYIVRILASSKKIVKMSKQSYGMSLLEVLLALAILATIVLSITQILRYNIDIRLALSEKATTTQKLNRILTRINADLGQAFIISANVRQEVGTISYSRTLFTAAAVTLLIIAILSGTRLMGFSAFEYAGLIMLGIVPTLLGHGSMYYAIRYVSPTVVASTPMGEPVLASIMACFLFQETVGIATFIGGSITLIGLILLVQKNK